MGKAEWLDVELRHGSEWMEAYRLLRNQYCELLLSDPVELVETDEWIRTTSALVHVLIFDSVLMGAYIIYPQRGHELAFFARTPGAGIGKRLLESAERTARAAGFPSLWAWVRADNSRARNSFLSAGFDMAPGKSRRYRGQQFEGDRFEKKISGEPFAR